MKKFIGVLLFLFVDVIVASTISSTSTSKNVIVQQKCVEVGGYCQNSWDCCSQSCLSFSYKCVKGRPPSVVSISVLDPNLISVDTLEELVNRFGNDDDKTLAPTTIATTERTSPTTSSSIVDNNSNSTQCVGIGYECSDSSQCCSNECLHYFNIHICIDKRTPTVTDAPAECLLIGKKCYRHDECCTKRCHGYLHQCVT